MYYGLGIQYALANIPYLTLESIEWTNGLFDCSDDIGTFVKSCVCPCLVFANNKKALNNTGNILPVSFCGQKNETNEKYRIYFYISVDWTFIAVALLLH